MDSAVTTSAASSTTHFVMLPIELIRESPDNPRRYYDETKQAELTASIRQFGLLQPVTVRPRDGGTWYELAAGHRRRLSGLAAPLTHLPALVRDLDDTAFLELLNVDNLQRDDLHPMDESHGYAMMQEKLGYDVAALALKVGKSLSYIYQRLSLQRLIPAAQDLFWKGEMTLGHAVLLVRANPEQQQAVIDDLWREDHWRREDGDPVTVSDLRSFLEHEVYRSLQDAPWDATDVTLVPTAGACNTCDKRSGCSPSLFPDIESADICLDGTCFATKLSAAIERKVEDAQAQHGEVVRLTSAYSQTKLKPESGQPIPQNQWWEVKPNTKGAVAAVKVDGYDVGAVTFVTLTAPKARDVARPTSAADERYKKENAAREAKVKAERQRRQQLLDAIVPRLPSTTLLAADDLRYLITGFLEEMHYESRKLAARRLDETADAQASVAVITKWAKTASVNQLVTFLFTLPLIAALQVSSYQETRSADTILDVTAKRLKVRVGGPVARSEARKKRAGDVRRAKTAKKKARAR